MRNLAILITLMLVNVQTSAQYYVPYEVPAYGAPRSNYESSTPQYVPNIENNGPQVDQRRNAERSARQLDNMNTIRNYQIIYGDTYR